MMKYTLAESFLIIILLLTSCTTPGQSTQLIATESALSPSSPTVRPENSPTITITPSPVPVTPSLTRPSPETTPSRTLLPTLNATQRLDYFFELSKPNGSCKLPCWWDITPGKSSWDEIQGRLAYLGWKDVAKPKILGSTMHTPYGQFQMEVKGYFHGQQTYFQSGITFVEKANIIEDINIYSDGVTNPPLFNSLWMSYMPREILRAYGEPTRIWMYTNPTLMGTAHGYDLLLIYDRLGFILKYNGWLQISGKNFRVCISNRGEDLYTLDLHLQSPEDPNPLEQNGYLGPLYNRETLSIEEAAGLTGKEFYEKFIQSDESVCFDTPMSVWR